MGKLQSIGLGELPKWFNKFTVATAIFLLWIGFFGNNNLITQYKIQRTISKMENEKEQLIQQIAQAKVDREDLNRNIEKYAREKYYMHKDNEEVFIIDKK